MANFTVKRSMSPDGKIDSVSVEIAFEAEIDDKQAILDAIQITDAYAAAVRNPKAYVVQGQPVPTGDVPPGVPQQITGSIQAVYEGEPSRTSGKMGPGAIIIDGIKVKTFDKNSVEKAKNLKANGQQATATFNVNQKWKSNDLVKLDAAVQ